MGAGGTETAADNPQMYVHMHIIVSGIVPLKNIGLSESS
jgi:hypothetical protein